jgi:hypothetical protein
LVEHLQRLVALLRDWLSINVVLLALDDSGSDFDSGIDSDIGRGLPLLTRYLDKYIDKDSSRGLTAIVERFLAADGICISLSAMPG